MGVKLYGMSGSPNVRGAMLGLTEKGVDYELVNLMPPALKTREHLARNPFGKVPVLDHDGFEASKPKPSCAMWTRRFPVRHSSRRPRAKRRA